MSVRYVVGLHEQPDDLGWWSEHLGGFTTNIFAATKYGQNEAVGLVGAFKEQGVDTYTEMVQVAGARHQKIMREQADSDWTKQTKRDIVASINGEDAS